MKDGYFDLDEGRRKTMERSGRLKKIIFSAPKVPGMPRTMGFWKARKIIPVLNDNGDVEFLPGT